MDTTTIDGGSSGDWPYLPHAVLKIIVGKLLPYNIADIAGFRSVCSSWRSATSDADVNLLIHSSSQLPWLMLPYPLSSSFNTRLFFSLSSPSSSRLHLPQLRGKTYRGTNHGWLFVLNTGIKTPPFLFNPFTQSCISLPPLPLPTIWKEKGPYDYSYPTPSTTPQLPDDNSQFLQPGFSRPSLAYAVLSADPSLMSSSDLEVMAIHGRELRLSFSRPGDAAWTPVVNCDSGQPSKLIRCLAYWNARFYVIDDDDNLLVVSNTRASPPPAAAAITATVLLPLPQRKIVGSNCYLIGSDQGLLLVIKTWVYCHQRKYINFQVFNLVELLEEEEGKHRWEKVESIGEQSLFISEENSLAVSTSGWACCKPSCIYYCDIYDEKGLLSETCTKLIEFCIEDGTTKIITCSSKNSTLLCRPLWIQPSLRL